MADTVRGLTVEINADAKKFNNGMNEMRREAKNSQAELSALQKSLELEFDADTFARAQQVAQRAMDETSQNADMLRKRLEYLESIGTQDTAEYRKLQTELAQTETKGKELEKQLEKINNTKTKDAQKEVDSLSNSLEGAQIAAAGLAATAGAALVTIGKLGLNAIKAADDIATLTAQHDATAESIQRMQYIALQSDVADTDFYNGLTKVRAVVADIASGTTNAAGAALQRLQLDLNSYDGSEEQFYAIITALSEMENQTDMVAIANEVFGDKLANKLLPLIRAGGGAIAEYSAEFETLGAMTDEQVEALAAFDNVLNRIKTQLSNATNQIGAAFLPVLERIGGIVEQIIVPALQKFADWLGQLSDGQLTFIVVMLGVVVALGTLVAVLPLVTKGVKSFKTSLTSLKGAFDKLAAHPIILIIMIIAAVLALLYTTNEQFRESINRLLETLANSLAPILETISGLISALVEALAPVLETVGNLLALVINLVLDALAPLFDIINILVGIITGVLNGALGMVFGLIGSLLGVLMPLVDILGTVLTVALDAVFTALSPVFAMLDLMFQLIMPLIQLALIPLQIQLQLLAVPLKFLGALLNWLAPLFTKFAEFVQGKFEIVIGFVNKILKGVEDAVNWVIDKINGLIRGINNLGGWLGIHINEIQKVSLSVSMGGIGGNVGGGGIDTSGAPEQPDSGFVYDGMDTDGWKGGDTYNYDNSNKTQNVTVVVQNYAEEVDVDDLVKQINNKLSEAM